jgi:hypothetical protein
MKNVMHWLIEELLEEELLLPPNIRVPTEQDLHWFTTDFTKLMHDYS